MPDPTEAPAWLQHEGCDQRIAGLEVEVRRLQLIASDHGVTSCEDLCPMLCAGPCEGRPIGPVEP